jgi:hypothetical protein
VLGNGPGKAADRIIGSRSGQQISPLPPGHVRRRKAVERRVHSACEIPIYFPRLGRTDLGERSDSERGWRDGVLVPGEGTSFDADSPK